MEDISRSRFDTAQIFNNRMKYAQDLKRKLIDLETQVADQEQEIIEIDKERKRKAL